MSNKELQRQRMERYLIDAAKKIIREQGIEEVTVRNVAKEAGYSYATMYNYFADLNELLWYVVADYIDELYSLLKEAARQNEEAGVQGVTLFKNVLRAYVTYYLENPGAFRFGFFQKIGEPPAAITEKLKNPVMADLSAAQLMASVREGLLLPQDVPAVADIMSGFVHGLLLFYFSERQQLTNDELFLKLDRGIDFLFSGKKTGGE